MTEMTIPEFCRWYADQLRTDPAKQSFRAVAAVLKNGIAPHVEHEQKQLQDTIDRVRALLTAEAEFHFIAPELLREALDGPAREQELAKQALINTPITPLILPLDEDGRT